MLSLIFALLVSFTTVPLHADTPVSFKHEWTNQYDDFFRQYTHHYFGPYVDWRWFKAQAIAESSLNPKAVSPAGAIGMMQILPSTYRYIMERNPFLESEGINTVRSNIAAGISYDRYLYLKWQSRKHISSQESLKFTFGSYNAGYTNILRAFNRAKKHYGEVSRWEQVAPFAPRETRSYVKQIEKWMEIGGL